MLKMPPDVTKVAGKSSRVLFENEKVRVLEIKFRKGQKLAMHSHPANFVYAITPTKFKSTWPDGKTNIVKMRKGEFSFSSGSSHAIENLTPGLSLVIEFK